MLRLPGKKIKTINNDEVIDETAHSALRARTFFFFDDLDNDQAERKTAVLISSTLNTTLSMVISLNMHDLSTE